jgi:hypothetical protein
MKKPMPCIVPAILACLASGCTSPAEKKSPTTKTTHHEETVEYTPVGSHISTRVKKPVKDKYAEEDQGTAYLRDAQSFPKFTDMNEGSRPPKQTP